MERMYNELPLLNDASVYYFGADWQKILHLMPQLLVLTDRR